MDNLSIILPTLIVAAVGIITTLIAAYASLKGTEKQFDFRIKELERQTRTENIKKYLNPLQVAAKDIKAYLSNNISKKFDDPVQKKRLKSDFSRIKNDTRNNKLDFANWCNGAGHEAAAGLYSTAVYFSYASKIRSELPFIELQPGEDRKLFDHLSSIRISFGGTYGIWEVLQDSIGSYVHKADGSVLNYKEFCTEIIDIDRHIWYQRLIDFYNDFDMKQADINRILASLNELIEFLDKKGLSSPR